MSKFLGYFGWSFPVRRLVELNSFEKETSLRKINGRNSLIGLVLKPSIFKISSAITKSTQVVSGTDRAGN